MPSKNIDKALGYAQKLVGTKYGAWKGGQSTRDMEGPFWVAGKKLPTAKYVKDRTCNCAGLINLIRRAVGLSVPGVEKKDFQYAGGTHTWFQYLEKKRVLEVFDVKKKYPVGTLLLRPYKNVEEQGHMAVIVDTNKKGVLFSKLLHCYFNVFVPEKDGKRVPGVVIDGAVGQSHFWRPEGLYTHACLPKNWLEKE